MITNFLLKREISLVGTARLTNIKEDLDMIYRSLYRVPTWKVRNPFEELHSMRQQMDHFLDAFSGRAEGRITAGVFPSINLSEDQENYYIRAELPGIKADELDIKVTAKNVSLSGERKISEEGDGVQYHRREREAGSFSRVIALPGDFDADKVSANLVDGLLTLTIAKAEAAKPRQITIHS
jgi:HSP20 family protein